MPSDNLGVTFICQKCGADPAILELPDDHTDHDIAKCKACGHEFGRYGDVKAEAMKAARSKVDRMARSAFKGFKSR